MGQSAFRTTQWGRILDARDPESARALLSDLARQYWRPVYRYIRAAWRKENEEAKDLTQEFFAEVFRPEFLARADPSRGSFRNFLLASLRNFLRDEGKRGRARKRGGGEAFVPIEEEAAPAPGADPEALFLRAWAETVLSESLGELRGRLRPQVFDAFRLYCVEGAASSYRDVADKTGRSVSEVTNDLFEARRELRRILLRRVGACVADEAQAALELKELFGS
jgi:RNA polymerase sigma-70 factor (ECF subfamily)